MGPEKTTKAHARPSPAEAAESAAILRRYLAEHPALPAALRLRALPDAIAELEAAARAGSNGKA